MDYGDPSRGTMEWAKYLRYEGHMQPEECAFIDGMFF
jgi:hypothetical protein